MNNEINNIDDLFDDSISRSLKHLGIVFPRTFADLKKINENLYDPKVIKSGSLTDPYSFLGKRRFSRHVEAVLIQNDYFNNLSQAAREGREISDEIRKKMAEDKR